MNSSTLVILFLALVAAGLVCAVLYGLFGKPTSSDGKKRKEQIISGFQLAGGVLLGCVLMGTLVVFAGVAFGVASSPEVSRVHAALIAVSALTLIALMIQRWAKYVAGWMIWGVLNSLLMASSGHLLNNPAIPVRRSYALTMAVLSLITVAVSGRFTKAYKLDLADKVALMTWISAFTLAANFEQFSVVAFSLGTLALVIAWRLHRSKGRRHRVTVSNLMSRS